MLSPASFPASSAPVVKVGLGPVQGTSILRAFTGAQPSTPTPPQPVQILPDQGKPAPPQAPAPRGSLLDISV
jgi:hypothetical protein